ncbi:MAG: hypothetical protein ACOYO0_02585 [Sandarakinorhabdus sp.]
MKTPLSLSKKLTYYCQLGCLRQASRAQVFMKKFYVCDSLPKKADHVAALLDADITKSRFQRSNSDVWFDAIKTRALTRVPGYSYSFHSFVSHNYLKDAEQVILAKLVSRGSSISESIKWITEGRLGKNQVNHAINGAVFMTFEKAVVCILALNSLIVEDISRYESDLVSEIKNLADIESNEQLLSKERVKSIDSAVEIDERIQAIENAIENLKEILIGEHSIVISCFYFYGIAPVIRAAIGSEQFQNLNEVAAFLSKGADQPASVIIQLLGDIDSQNTTNDKIDRAVKHVASYPTMRAVFKTLLKINICKDAVGTANREEFIQRLHVGIGNKKAIPEERMIDPRKITRPPYDWDGASESEEPYPPGYDDD